MAREIYLASPVVCSLLLCMPLWLSAIRKQKILWDLKIPRCSLTVAIFVGLKQGCAMQIAPSSIVPILILGLLNTVIGCYFYFSSIGKLKVRTVAICGYLEPLSAVLFSVAFLKETMLPLQIIGAVLIIGGAMCGELIKQKRHNF